MTDINRRIADLPIEKRRLLEKYLSAAGVNLSQSGIIPRDRNTGDGFPLSYAQQRLWFLHQLEPDTPVYNLPDSHYFKGSLDISALQRSLTEIIRRHESLRTTFRTVDAEPRQFISPPFPLKLEIIDLRSLSDPERAQSAQRELNEEAQRIFDLSQCPLFRARLLRLAEDEHILMLTMHHIISDGWSIGVLVKELTTLYEAYREGRESPLEELGIQYVDYAEWQRAWLRGEVLEEQLRYWRERLSGELPVLELPTDRPRPPVLGFRGTWESLTLPLELVERLRALSREAGATLFMTLLAAFNVLLARYSNQTDILVGTPIANRNRAEIENLIGFFVNTLVIRCDLSGNPSFREVLARTRETTLGAYAHQDLPFEKLVEELQPERDASHTPLFQVMFAMQNLPAEAQASAGLEVERFDAETETAKFDLTLFAHEVDDGLFCWLQYNTDLFEAATVRRMLRCFQTLLESIAGNPEQRISELALLPEAERRLLLYEWNQTQTRYPRESCLHELFEAEAERQAEKVAVVYGEEEISYGELNRRANDVARGLRACGVKPDVLVGISIERSLEMIVGLLAILKAGGAYVPLDASYPAQRLRFMLEDAGVGLVLAGRGQDEAWLPETVRVVYLDDAAKMSGAQGAENPPNMTSAENLAYVTYTSGSTGQPKGVEIPHRGVVRLVKESNYTKLDSGEVFLQFAPLAFDASTFEIWGSLLNGARLVIMPPALASLEELGQALQRHRVTTLWLTAGLFHLMVEEHLAELAGVPQVLAGGDVLSVAHVRKFLLEAGEGCTLINGYGPTENTTFTCCYAMRGETTLQTSVPIGRPVANTQVYILDSYLQPVVMGVVGELYVGGCGLARGYHNRAALTAEKFIPHPFSLEAGARLYRTGDLARYLDDGRIEFLGRSDAQLKVRGFRIELGEIEATLGAHGQVDECVVVAREDKQGEKRIVAYVVALPEATTSASELRLYLKERLPEYMLPASILMLDALPLTANGKVDRRRLPAPEQSSEAEGGHAAHLTPVEEIVAGIWSDVLGVSSLGVFDNFFSMGGHSLLATQVVSRVRRAFQIELPLRSLFEHPTPRQLAADIETRLRAGQHTTAPPFVRVSRERATPLSFAQQRLWFIEQFEPGTSLYNIPLAMFLKGELDIAALSRTLDGIMHRHEALRTTFAVEDGEPVQVIHEPHPFALPLIDLSALAAGERERRAEQLVDEEAARGFNLETGPLLRAALLRLADDEHILMLTMHHIISDGWSMGVFVRELAALYEASRRGEEPPLAELPVQYADFAVWQRDWLQGEVLEEQLAYWRQQLAGATGLLELPCDRPRPKTRRHRGGSHEFALESELVGALKELSRREGATLFMTLLAAFDVLLARYSGQDDIIVGTPIANRNRAEIENLIGFFVNTLVIRCDLSGNPSFRELLQRVREVALGAYAHQDVPFEKIVEELQPARDMSRTPLFQVMLVLQNAPEEVLELSGLQLGEVVAGNTSAKFDLTLMLQETDDEMHARFAYDADLFDASTIERAAGNFKTLLQGIVANPEQRLSRLPLLTDGERQQLLFEWNEAAYAGEQPRLLHQLFEQQAARTPDAVAARFANQFLSYAELNRRSNIVARHLISQGVGAESLVAVLLPRSLEMLVALVGILKAGAAYLPLDAAYPHERLRFMLEDSEASLLITHQEFLSLWPEHQTPRLCLDAAWFHLPEHAEAAIPQVEISPEQVAYVIYTSGSTGVPKGVAIRHASAAALLSWAADTFSAGELSGTLASTSICFDLSVFELFAPLSCGGSVVLVENALHLSGMAGSGEVRLINTVPSAMAELVRMQAVPDCVRVVNLAGEALKNELVQSIYAESKVERVFNLYGPTEDTTYSTCALVERGARREPSIGRAVKGTQVYVLDEELEPSGVGIRGEIYIGGAGLARGYVKRFEKTAEKFVPNPYGRKGGERMYRTGDLGRYLSNGEIEYLGRIDEQVKLRGYRIELGEIEARLRRHEGIGEAVAVVREETDGDKRIVAYVTQKQPEAAVSASELRGYLREWLPDYMIPSAFVTLDALPLTANGKVDRRSLPAPEQNATEERERFVAPRNALEETLALIWSEILGVGEVGVESGFFDLGGHSLLATRLVSRVRERFGVELPLRALFESPTVAGVARYIEKAQPQESDLSRLSLMLENLENISEEEVRALLALTESEQA